MDYEPIEVPQHDPSAELSWWVWIFLIIGVLSGAVLLGLFYLAATGQTSAP